MDNPSEFFSEVLFRKELKLPEWLKEKMEKDEKLKLLNGVVCEFIELKQDISGGKFIEIIDEKIQIEDENKYLSSELVNELLYCTLVEGEDKKDDVFDEFVKEAFVSSRPWPSDRMFSATIANLPSQDRLLALLSEDLTPSIIIFVQLEASKEPRWMSLQYGYGSIIKKGVLVCFFRKKE